MSLTKHDRPVPVIDRFFEEGWAPWPAGFRAFFEGADIMPMRLEQFEADGTLVVRAEMPGLDPETDIDISVADHTLQIRAERREEHESGKDEPYRSEFRYGSFARTMALPAGAAEDAIKATYSDGILEVRVPIDAGAADAKRVPVTRT